MKAITAVSCATGASVPAIATGRISRQRDGENAEIQMYLSKLKDLVPYMPKNKKLSKLEVIQNVIDYICDLQSALETTGGSGAAFDASAVLSEALNPRQPLGIRSNPNTIHRRRPSLHSNSSSSSTTSNNGTSSVQCDLTSLIHTVSKRKKTECVIVFNLSFSHATALRRAVLKAVTLIGDCCC